jgi:hypothetical protein
MCVFTLNCEDKSDDIKIEWLQQPSRLYTEVNDGSGEIVGLEFYQKFRVTKGSGNVEFTVFLEYNNQFDQMTANQHVNNGNEYEVITIVNISDYAACDEGSISCTLIFSSPSTASDTQLDIRATKSRLGTPICIIASAIESINIEEII